MKPDTLRVPLLTVTARPAELSYAAYKQLQRQQDRALRAYRRGRLVHDAAAGPYRKPSPTA